MLKKGWFYYAAVVSGCAVLLWVATFFTHRLTGFVLLLFVAMFLGFGVVIASHRREYTSLQEFWGRCCKPLFVLTMVVILYAFFNFFISALIMEGGGPQEMQDGFYLTSHGDVLRELTEAEFVRLKKTELRMFFGHVTAFSGISLTYLSARVPELWGRKKKEEPQDDRIIYLNKE